ncbi:hypothetical protein B0H14DRAFT_2599035 [Mycena olivaceomarginata]|nr:hypothetical protein B0H14DRAFT_2599035 [Mycena olivaceomarginata]
MAWLHCPGAPPAFTLHLIIHYFQILDSYSNNVQDRFFSLTKAADSEALTDNETQELMYFYTILRLVDHSVPNHKIYTILYENCIGETDSLEASNLNEAYQQSSERGDDSTNPSLNQTFYAELLHWRCVNYNLLDFCTKIDMVTVVGHGKKEVKVLGSNQNGKAMEFISDEENEKDMAKKKLVPILPNLPKGLSEAKLYNFQQKLEPDARAVLMRAIGHKLVKAEENIWPKFWGSCMVIPATVVFAGNIDFLKSMIGDLGPRAENSGTILEKLNEHAKDGIQIHHIPLYHTSTSASKNSCTPTIYGDEFGNLATFLHGTPAASLKNFPDSAEIHLALLLTLIEPTQVGIVHTCNPKLRVLLLWDVNILHTELNKTKESLDTSTQDALRQARNNNCCPNFQTFWINKGWNGNHDNRCLKLTLKGILRIACEGLSIRKGEDGAVQKIPGFIKVDYN